MTTPRILIAGIGNIFLGDDAFGVEVARRLAARPQPPGVNVADFGIRGLDLAFALLEEHDLVILVDAAPRGGPPGTLYVIEPGREDLEAPEGSGPMVETHGMDPLKVLRLAHSLGGRPRAIRVVGCEPATLGTEEEPALGLSAVVREAVDEAVPLIERLVAAGLAAPAGETKTESSSRVEGGHFTGG
jgi:hydrogenase maturation protease